MHATPIPPRRFSSAPREVANLAYFGAVFVREWAAAYALMNQVTFPLSGRTRAAGYC